MPGRPGIMERQTLTSAGKSRLYGRRTKIVCTIGPATSSPSIIERLIRKGMDVARLNMSHGTREEHARHLEIVRKAGGELDIPVAVLLDLPGPKYRIGKLQGGQTVLKRGTEVVLTPKPVEGNSTLLPVTLPSLSKALRPGQKVLLDDGALQLRVLAIEGDEVRCRVVIGGPLLQGKGVVAPNMRITNPFITDSLRDLLAFAVEQKPDYVALSFVTHAQDVLDARAILESHGASIPIVSKIERDPAVRDFDRILEVSDAIMVARGDLGVDINLERVPLVQKEIIKKCNQAGKPVITATEMLESMINSPRPTRAETTDVANAIFDGTDAIMLSAETSIGSYPVQAVSMMNKIARETEARLPYDLEMAQRGRWFDRSTEELIGYNACLTAHNLDAKAIVAYTESGSTAGRVSKYRPRMPILAVTPTAVCGRLVLYWGVHPFRIDAPARLAELLDASSDLAKCLGLARPGDRIIVTGGFPVGAPGSTNLLKVHEVTA